MTCGVHNEKSNYVKMSIFIDCISKLCFR